MLFQPRRMPLDDAETIALKALAFIASDESRLARFIGETGISLEQLHREAGALHVLVAVLETLLRNEPDLLMFTANAGLAPDSVTLAHFAIEAAAKGEPS